MLDDVVRLRHMLDAATEACAYVEGQSKAMLLDDTMRTLAMVKCIEILGEAATQISEPFKDKHPDLPWQIMKGLRNRLVHAYFDVDISILWETATHNLPPLIEQLSILLTAYDPT
ncbi:MAG: DUF86 domain-containing protein [Phycisphaerales bacterium JB063]